MAVKTIAVVDAAAPDPIALRRAIMKVMVHVESLAAPSLETAEPDTPLIAQRGFWLVTIAIWSFFGLMVANQLFFSMRGHGHHWWRIGLWQMAGAVTWMLLTPMVFALKARFPLGGARRLRALGVHAAAAVSASLVRMLPMTAVSLAIDPYWPVPTEGAFWAEYAAQAVQWLPMDLFLYGAILVVAYTYGYRAQVHRDQLHAAVLEKELHAAELRALKLELQPHFLFNTMNAIVSLVRMGDAARAERMLLGLCEMLRTTLDGRRQPLVPVRDEVAFTERYLDIQRIRFGDRLDARWQIADDAAMGEMPALLLQPLVENAVRHAVERGDGRGQIVVAIARVGDAMRVDVDDDGPTDAPAPASEPARPPRRGLGLDNVRGRLAALYGDAWTLQLAARETGGVRVTLTFPWRRAGADEIAA
ncbi:MAG: histidine kinase [Acidobacteriota bacterium]